MLRPGTILGDRYEIIEKIGTGGMADVYKAKCHKLNRYVAIKVLKSEYSSNKNFVSKFRVEAQSAAGLMHPNIVNVYDVGDENGMYYFVMELIEGITLKNYIEKKIRLSIKEAVSIAIQVSMGIEAAHNNNIIHRDIKPQNIMISREGKVKVADFGIARAATRDTITSHAMGSVHYTSPEQARGGYSDAKSDIYSIGITLFEMITGRVPFDGETTVSIAIKHIQEEMPSPRVYVPEVPISVEQIIFKCTQKNPDRRYANMSELIQDLKRSLISPDENFVVIHDAASSEGTKNISDLDRQKIRSYTSQGGSYGQPITTTNGMYAGEYANEYAMPHGGYKQPGYREMAYQDSYEYEEQNGYQAPYEYQDTQSYQGYPEPHMYQDSNQMYADSYNNQQMYQDQYGGYQDPEDDFDDEEAFSPRRREKRRYRQVDPEQQYSNQYSDDLYDDQEMDEVDPKMEKVLTILGIVVAIIIALGAIFVICKLVGVFDSKPAAESDSGQIAVPDLVGKTISEATQLLTDAGLTAGASYVEGTEYEKDVIVSQDPISGTMVDKGTKLTIGISSGKTVMEGVSVPDVVGKSEAEAKVAIENEGFTMQKTELASDTVEKGVVISQDPLGATTLPKGSAVKVAVSTGKSTSQIEVPDLIGKDETTAKSLLTQAGLTWTEIKEENSDSVLAGLVISQTYSAGMMVDTGTSVDFTVSLGAPGYSCSVNIDTPPNYLSGSEAIVVLLGADNTEIQRFSTSSFPYTMQKTGIVGSTSGFVTVTYQMSDGQWQTTAPQAVTFTKE